MLTEFDGFETLNAEATDKTILGKTWQNLSFDFVSRILVLFACVERPLKDTEPKVTLDRLTVGFKS